MYEKIISALEGLKSVVLLNPVGEALLEFMKANPDSDTVANMEVFYDGQDTDEIRDHMATSVLAGNDTEKAVQDWIAENDREVFLQEYLQE